MSTQVLALNCLVPGQNLESYIQTVNTLPVLTAEEEARLAHRFRDDGDLDAARQLVMSHLRFVVHIARGYSGYGLPQADLVQEGNIGLMKAVKRFDPAFGVRLVSFAVHWIKAEMHEFILRNWRIVKVATTKAQRKLFFNLRSAKKRLGWMTRAEAESVARDLGVDVADVVQMEGRLAAHDASFDGDVDDEDDWAMSPAQYLPDPNSDPADIVSANDWQDDNVDRLGTALSDLDERSRDIIASRWLADRKSTLHELADRYGVSAERIRQLEKNALRKLRGALEEAVA